MTTKRKRCCETRQPFGASVSRKTRTVHPGVAWRAHSVSPGDLGDVEHGITPGNGVVLVGYWLVNGWLMDI